MTLVSSNVGAAPLRVRGATVIEPKVSLEGDALVVRATLRGDAGEAVPDVELALRVLDAASRAPRALPPPSDCGATRARSRRPRYAPDEGSLATDDAGAICLRLDAPARGALVELRFDGDARWEPSRVERAADLGSRVSLAFASLGARVSLDREALVAQVVASGDPPELGAGLAVRLSDDRDVALAEARTDADGRASFEVATSRLAGPGAGLLRASADGASVAEAPIVRTARVELSASAPGGPFVADEGVPLDVVVATSRGPASDGVVEARVGGEIVGAARVIAGHAELRATFAVTEPATTDVEIAYRATSSGYEAGANARAAVRVRPPSPWRHLPLALLVSAVGAWVVRGWRRAPRRRADSREAPMEPAVAAALDAQSRAGTTGRVGVVLDAHEGTPVAGARVACSAPTFAVDAAPLVAIADARGVFVVSAAAPAGCRVVVEAPGYARAELALPRAGLVRVALVSRRRKVLERFATWAEARFSARGRAATPGEVAARARRTPDDAVARWASSVERAAYGPEPPDEGVEQALAADAPAARGSSATSIPERGDPGGARSE